MTSANPSTTLADTVVDELIRCGVADVVLSPGSRSAPLALAIARADRIGRLRLHVRIDERTAGFLAVGLARGGRRPVPVVCTSGSAVANLHPAVLEAHHDGVPLLLLTADRPPELRGVGANQVTDQPGLFGRAVRMSHDLAAPAAVDGAAARAAQVRYWRSVLARACLTAAGVAELPPGPVHLNIPFAEPLLPDLTEEGDDIRARSAALSTDPAAPDRESTPAGRDVPWTRPGQVRRRRRPRDPEPDLLLDRSVPTVVVAGHGASAAAAELAESGGWPLLAEPSSGSWGGPNVISAGPYVAGCDAFVRAHQPRRVVVMGRPTLSRQVLALLEGSSAPAARSERRTGSGPITRPGDRRHREVVVVRGSLDAASGWADPTRTAEVVAVRPAAKGRPVNSWLDEWRGAGAAAWLAVRDLLTAGPWDVEPAVVHEVVATIAPGSVLVLAASQPVRDVNLVARPRHDIRVLANRGLSGIDGTVSSAVGAALTAPAHTYCVMGDLAFLHDVGGLFLGPAEPRPDVTFVVLNNDGGGIFHLLAQGAPGYATDFERVFGTPTGVRLADLCSAAGVRYSLPADREGLRHALTPGQGIHVVEVPTDRSNARGLHRQLRAVATAAIG